MTTKTPTFTPPTVNPYTARLEALTCQLGESDVTLQAADVAVAERRAEAITAALHARDLAFCVGDIVLQTDADYGAARNAAAHTAHCLRLARTALVQATHASCALASQFQQLQRVAAAAQTRAQVLAARQDLADQLKDAQQALAEAQQATGTNGQYLQQRAAFVLQQVEERITEACVRASVR